MPKKLIPANKDPKYSIKETDRFCWHVLITRVTLDKDDPKKQTRDSFVQIFDTKNFDRIFRPERLGPAARDYKKAALIDESRVIHNPEEVTDEPYVEEPVAYTVVKPPVQPEYSKAKRVTKKTA